VSRKYVLSFFTPARLSQINKIACTAVLAVVLLGMVADVSIDAPRGSVDWRQRVIVLLPGVCAQPAALPPTPDLPPVPLALQPDQWPIWPDWLICGGVQARQDARGRALATFVGGYGSPTQLTDALNQALQNSLDGLQSIPFTILAIEAFSYAGDTPIYETSQTRQPLPVSAQALDTQFRDWQRKYPHAAFDLIGHSLGGAVGAYWAASVASPEELRAVHMIVTLDSPLDGYPRNYADNFFLPFFGPVARNLLAGDPDIQSIKRLPKHWISGPDTLASPLVTVTNVRDLVVPFSLATIPGAVLVADDFGSDANSLNHGAVLTSPTAFAQIAQLLAQTGMPLLNAR
jgi:hypothetical protein